MHNRHHCRNPYRSDLFQPPPPTPAWNSLPQPVVQSIVELLARLLRAERTRRALLRKEVGNE